MSNNKNKLRSELKNLYGGTNKFLTNAEISDFVNKYTGNNSMNVKKQAYRKAYTKYMNYMAGDFTQDIIRAIKAKMKSSPKCPSGVVGGGTSLGGTIRAVAGGMRAACGKSGQPNCSSVANRTRSKTSQN
tara:strand:+ start:1406 stop:1795 length:390 start_codon:yes stop_codon:yes gene_type:complete